MSLAELHPDVAAELAWAPGDRRPETISPGSELRCTWCCSTCAHEWDALVFHRVAGYGCPLCRKAHREAALNGGVPAVRMVEA